MHLWCELFPWLKGRGRIEATLMSIRDLA